MCCVGVDGQCGEGRVYWEGMGNGGCVEGKGVWERGEYVEGRSRLCVSSLQIQKSFLMMSFPGTTSKVTLLLVLRYDQINCTVHHSNLY